MVGVFFFLFSFCKALRASPVIEVPDFIGRSAEI
jgi:hypothetical protein